MLKIDGNEAYEKFLKNFKIGAGRFPHIKNYKRCRNHGLFPVISPSFKLKPGAKVFTIGSCFARNVEKSLQRRKLDLIAKDFKLPHGEIPYDDSEILNEYNVQTMLQRIKSVSNDFEYCNKKSIEKDENGFIDLFLHRGATPVSENRLIERREQISGLYREMGSADVVILTLGLVESWYDSEWECFINRAPSQNTIQKNPGRFLFTRLEFSDVLSSLTEISERIFDCGVNNIILTVSPVPIEATFMPKDVVVANGYSKSVLRAASEEVSDKFKKIDYFPSYEIVMSRGIENFRDDNVHVLSEVIDDVVDYMVENYID